MKETIGPKWKGDIYLLLPNHSGYPIFQATARKVIYEDWEMHNIEAFHLKRQDIDSIPYYEMWETPAEGSLGDVPRGILIPSRVDKGKVADDLRKRYGSKALLLMMDEEFHDGDATMFFSSKDEGTSS